jgi:hypothetical protein
MIVPYSKVDDLWYIAKHDSGVVNALNNACHQYILQRDETSPTQSKGMLEHRPSYTSNSGRSDKDPKEQWGGPPPK